MLFDMNRFAQRAKRAYTDNKDFSFEDTLSVFRYYFQRYEEQTGHAHPNINRHQIRDIMAKMPCIDLVDRGNSAEYLSAEDYPALIDQHFLTKYRRCDWNINHFFSGRIRELRFFEALY